MNLLNDFRSIQNFKAAGAMRQGEEPTYLTFAIDFDSNELMPEDSATLIPHSPLFAGSVASRSTSNADISAEWFLESRGLRKESAYLAEFKKQLNALSNGTPWFFQSISGLDKLWLGASNMSDGYKCKDAELEITTLESLDMRMTYLAAMYRKATTDGVFMRQLLPENLRRFAMKIYVAEFRNFSAFTQTGNSSAASSMIANADYLSKYASFLMFDCRMCEFDFSSSIPSGDFSVFGFDSPAANKFKIKVGWFYEGHQFSYRDLFVKEGPAAPFNTADDVKRKETLKGISGLVMGINATQMQ